MKTFKALLNIVVVAAAILAVLKLEPMLASGNRIHNCPNCGSDNLLEDLEAVKGNYYFCYECQKETILPRK